MNDRRFIYASGSKAGLHAYYGDDTPIQRSGGTVPSKASTLADDPAFVEIPADAAPPLSRSGVKPRWKNGAWQVSPTTEEESNLDETFLAKQIPVKVLVRVLAQLIRRVPQDERTPLQNNLLDLVDNIRQRRQESENS